MKKLQPLYKWQLYSFHDNLGLQIKNEDKNDWYYIDKMEKSFLQARFWSDGLWQSFRSRFQGFRGDSGAECVSLVKVFFSKSKNLHFLV